MKCDNKIKCVCKNTECENHSKCCECVARHIERGNLPVCLRQLEEKSKKML